MSLETLRRMQEYYRAEDEAIDNRDASFNKKAKEQLPEEEVKKRGEELYAKVVKVIDRQLNEERKRKALVSCKFQPHCVFKYVVDKINAKPGWKAKHSFNYGYNFYDFIEATPPQINPVKDLLADAKPTGLSERKKPTKGDLQIKKPRY